MSASTGQSILANNLYAERIIPDAVWSNLQRKMSDPLVRPGALRGDFDAIIRANYPRRAASVPLAAGSEWPDWSDVEQSSYALPNGTVPEETFRRLAGRHGEAEFIFFEVKLYRGKWYCKKLTGAPGRFSRSNISSGDQRALHDFLARGKDVQETATRLFGYLYKICGVCKAELTDDYSREVSMGPHCRKTRYGYKR